MLPTTKSSPKSQIVDYTVLLYGPSKAGKSTWSSQAQDAVFLATEPGLNALEVFQVPITSWENMLSVCAEIAEGKHNFKTIVIDTIDNAYKLCADYVCAKAKVEHESDLSYGKGYALVNNEFQRVLNKLAFLPYGLILISHSQLREVDTRIGKINRMVPTLPDKARKIVTGLVDMILYTDLEQTKDAEGTPVIQRVIRTKPHTSYDAGDRTGRLPEMLPMNYAAFAAAFNQAVTPASAPANEGTSS
jgi:hypothetical protein